MAFNFSQSYAGNASDNPPSGFPAVMACQATYQDFRGASLYNFAAANANAGPAGGSGFEGGEDDFTSGGGPYQVAASSGPGNLLNSYAPVVEAALPDRKPADKGFLEAKVAPDDDPLADPWANWRLRPGAAGGPLFKCESSPYQPAAGAQDVLGTAPVLVGGAFSARNVSAPWVQPGSQEVPMGYPAADGSFAPADWGFVSHSQPTAQNVPGVISTSPPGYFNPAPGSNWPRQSVDNHQVRVEQIGILQHFHVPDSRHCGCVECKHGKHKRDGRKQQLRAVQGGQKCRVQKPVRQRAKKGKVQELKMQELKAPQEQKAPVEQEQEAPVEQTQEQSPKEEEEAWVGDLYKWLKQENARMDRKAQMKNSEGVSYGQVGSDVD